MARRGVRLDSGVVDGSVVGVHYDPMLAKVIAWAPTRAEAARRWPPRWPAPGSTVCAPTATCWCACCGIPAFLDGDTDTAFLDRHGLDVLAAPLAGPADERLAAVAAALADAARRRAAATVLAAVPSGWRNVPASPQWSVLPGRPASTG